MDQKIIEGLIIKANEDVIYGKDPTYPDSEVYIQLYNFFKSLSNVKQ